MKLLITSLFFLSIFQSTYASYPTQWVLVSHSDQEICLKCEGKANGLPSPIPFQQCFINQKKVVWNGWYNDGLGLNWAKWQCKVFWAGQSIETQHPEHTFQTTWGENIRLTIKPLSNGQFSVQKTSLKIIIPKPVYFSSKRWV